VKPLEVSRDFVLTFDKKEKESALADEKRVWDLYWKKITHQLVATWEKNISASLIFAVLFFYQMENHVTTLASLRQTLEKKVDLKTRTAEYDRRIFMRYSVAKSEYCLQISTVETRFYCQERSRNDGQNARRNSARVRPGDPKRPRPDEPRR